ncbi:hypothetical protein TUM4249_13830 [Shewanella sp. KT0246]|nr:hypothetical protein TUM4249_13830 [Shewanella sp. KT0246]
MGRTVADILSRRLTRLGLDDNYMERLPLLAHAADIDRNIAAVFGYLCHNLNTLHADISLQ